jgi:transposase-like protein
MEDYPDTLTEFEQMFATEQACRDYIRVIRWPEGFLCPRCGHKQGWETKRNIFVCRQCGMHVSLLAGTIFQDTKKPLKLWFRAVWHITSQKYGTNALGIQRIMGFGSYRTAWSWLHKLRRAMVRPGRDRLAGTLQVDETFVGGEKPGERGRGAGGKVLVLVAVQEDEPHTLGRIRLTVIPDASAAAIDAALETMAEPGALIKTDGWSGYTGITSKGYQHEVIREESIVGDDLLPACHRVASLFKRWLLGTFQGAVGSDNLQYYLDEYTFRFNRRTSKSRGKLFYRLIEQAVAVEPVLVRKLKSDSTESDH